MQLDVPQAKTTIDKQYFWLAQEMMQYTMLWEGKRSKTTKPDRAVGTVYQIRAELIAAAIVSISELFW